MSLRLFVYWSALCGAWAALAGWVVGRLASGADPLGSAGFKGLYVGLLVGLALGVVDVLWSYSPRQLGRVWPRVLTAAVGGTLGGLVGGVLGQALFSRWSWALFHVLGWAVTGLLIGASLGLFDLLTRFVRCHSLRGSVRKTLQTSAGGLVGGTLGGALSWQLKRIDTEHLWSPSAAGFVVLGLCIGLMIGLAQVLFKEAWIRFEAGRRRGREQILTKPRVTLGRAESCDVGLFGDPAVERLHALLDRHDDGYVLTDADSGSGTFVNGRRICRPTRLHSGDTIGLGGVVLRFEERRGKGP